jgi:hypothetical protein
MDGPEYRLGPESGLGSSLVQPDAKDSNKETTKCKRKGDLDLVLTRTTFK